MSQAQIRNFSIIGHIDHGKSTLADRLLEITGTVPAREMRPQFLDKLEVERERGITVKLQAVRMEYAGFILNLIDTPGHVDFTYEVSRALAACEGVILLVDAAQGIQAQTLFYFQKAQKANLTVIPVINKIDLPHALIPETLHALTSILGFAPAEIVQVSAKTGEGTKTLLQAIIDRIPPPYGRTENPLRALVFDSFYERHKGVIVFIKVVDGEIESKQNIPSLKFLASVAEFMPLEIGVPRANLLPTRQILTGEVGYLATGIKDIKLCRVGDTVIKSEIKEKPVEPLPGYQIPKPMVFAELFPAAPDEYPNFKEAIEKVSLDDASLSCQTVNRPFLGAGFRCGFLGVLHLEIILERLKKEHRVEAFSTMPSPAYQNGQEPWVKVEIVAPAIYLGALLDLIKNRRGLFGDLSYLGKQNGAQNLNCIVSCELPFSELIGDFFNQVKSVSQGYGSLDYEFLGYRPADLVELSLLVNHQKIDPLSQIVVREKTYGIGKNLVGKLKELLPRQQFTQTIQAAIGSKIIARADIPALRKNVLAKLSGGHRERKDKLLETQKRGKAKLARFGKVAIPPEAFWAIFKSF